MMEKRVNIETHIIYNYIVTLTGIRREEIEGIGQKTRFRGI